MTFSDAFEVELKLSMRQKAERPRWLTRAAAL